jgi:tetratricopeptide (TPR) repeat protein
LLTHCCRASWDFAKAGTYANFKAAIANRALTFWMLAQIPSTGHGSDSNQSELGSKMGIQPSEQADAVTYFKRGSDLRSRGRINEALSCFETALSLRPDYAEAHNSRGIVLASLDKLDSALSSFEHAIALKVDYAEAINNRGLVLQSLGRLDEALISFNAAIALRPDNAPAHNNLGVVLRDLKRLDEALVSCDKAVALKSDYAGAYYNRGTIFQDLMQPDRALASYERAVALKPDYAEAYTNMGVVFQELRRPGDALIAFDQAIGTGRAPAAEVNTNRSYALLQLGHFEQGWLLHEWRKKLVPPVGLRSFSQPAWLGAEDIANKRLFVYSEQGLGDTIQFCRYAKMLKAQGADVVMSVQEPLYRLLKQLSPDVQIINQGSVPECFDFHCPLMSLPFALGTTEETIPVAARYIFPDEQLREEWLARLPKSNNKLRIGIVWSGNTKHKNDRNRSIDLSVLAPLFSIDASWISLQKDLTQGSALLLGRFPQVTSCGGLLDDFLDTAAVVDLLDLVITVDTSVAHLAGAMGKRVWILLPFNSDWRWLLGRDDSPWYPTARLFRQFRINSWDGILRRVQAELYNFVKPFQ